MSKIQKTRCLVRNVKDNKNRPLPFYYLNLDEVDADIQPPKNAVGIPKSSLKVGAKVGFKLSLLTILTRTFEPLWHICPTN
jgi:hypothetical protein